MNNFNKRVYETLGRVLIFATTHPQLFPKQSPTGDLLEEIHSKLEKLAEHTTSKISGLEDAQVSTAKRAVARRVLRKQLEAISETAKGLGLSQFWLPRDRSDRSLLEYGGIFASRVGLLKQTFIDSHLPPDFVERLGDAIQELERMIEEQVTMESARSQATSAILQTHSEAFATLKRLEPLMENLLRHDVPVLTVWRSARRVERYTRPRRAGAERPAGELTDPVTNPVDNSAVQA